MQNTPCKSDITTTYPQGPKSWVKGIKSNTPTKTNTTGWKIPIFNRKYIFKWLEFSIVMLVLGRVSDPFSSTLPRFHLKSRLESQQRTNAPLVMRWWSNSNWRKTSWQQAHGSVVPRQFPRGRFWVFVRFWHIKKRWKMRLPALALFNPHVRFSIHMEDVEPKIVVRWKPPKFSSHF